MTKDEALKLALEALQNNRQTHHYCEDTWYSCPKHEDGCANESEGDECNCGADKANAEIDKAITTIKEALAQPEQERFLVATIGNWGCVEWADGVFPSLGDKMYSAPRTWVGLTDEEMGAIYEQHHNQYGECESANLGYERAIEFKLKEKNELR